MARSTPEANTNGSSLIEISEEIRRLELPIALGVLTATVKVESRNEEIWRQLQELGRVRSAQYTAETIKEEAHIAAFREFYRRIGKDPSRYRPSSEMLIRRVVNGKPLYTINSVVDTMNLISIDTYLPLGLYDRDKIEGKIVFRIGRNGEGFPGIRKEFVNVASLPVLADSLGPFGDPSSDSERTMIRPETTQIMLVIFSCSGNPDQLLEKTADRAQELYSAHCFAADCQFSVIS